jgi:hypothetical protein
MSTRPIFYTNRGPDDLPMTHTVFWPEVIINYFHYHFRTELADTGPANTWKLLCNPVGQSIFQRFGQ